MPRTTPFLWFDREAEEAARHYVAIFPNSHIVQTTRYPEGSPGEPGSVMTVVWELDGQRYIGINGGPAHAGFTETVSFVIDCDTQEEIDHYWSRLSEGGQESVCGWLKDRFGLSWQVVPTALPELLAGDEERSRRVMDVILASTKLDLAALRAAADGVTAA
jgi:predicted 3-demethylubiquinone-9 3-methyltransferase (glyoxalase superfamily)